MKKRPRLAFTAAALLLALIAVLPPAPGPEAGAIALLDDADGERSPTCHDWVAVLPPRTPVPTISAIAPPFRRAAACAFELTASDQPIPSRAPPRV